MDGSTARVPFDAIAYEVQPADNLHSIVFRYYGSMSQNKVRFLADQVLQANPHILTPNSLRAGKLIQLPVPRNYCAAPKGFPFHSPAFEEIADSPWFRHLNHSWEKAAPEERAFLHRASPFLLGTGTAALTTLNTTFKTNVPLVGEIAGYYEAFQSGDLTRNQYDYRRRKTLAQLSDNLGPTQRLIHGDRKPGEVIRINRRSGVVPTANIDRQVRRMTDLSKVASRGGVALSVVGLGIACHEISQTSSRDRQNEILVESAGGVVGGVLYSVGAGIGLAMMATPVGWVGGLVIGVGGALAGYAGSKGTRKIYDLSGRRIDFVEGLGVTNACSGNRGAPITATNQISRGFATFQR